MIRYLVEYRDKKYRESYALRARYNYRTRETLYTLGYSCNMAKLNALDPYDPPALFSRIRDADHMVACLVESSPALLDEGAFYVITRNL